MLSVSEARERVLNAVSPLEVIEAPLEDSRGLVLARDAVAPHPLPRFDNSAMDGYALAGEDAAEASDHHPAELRVVGEVRAGDPGELRVVSGTAARIMTGAPLPPGADAVAPIEVVEEAAGKILVRAPAPPGANVRPAGEDVAEGDVVVQTGTELGAGEIAILASLGLTPAPVHRRPRVALLVTGDELVAVGHDPLPGQIRDSNSLALAALCEEAGAEVALMEHLPDDRDATLAGFERAARDCDVIVSSGGVSVGKYDYVKDVVQQLGGIDLWRVAMQPGKPVVLGRVKDKPFLGLPGNPVSIHIGFEQFVRPALRKMRGLRALLRPTVRARLEKPLRKSPGRLQFVRVRLAYRDEIFWALPAKGQGSHMQSSLVGCHGVAHFAADATHLEAGDEVEVEVWRLPEGQ